MGFIDRQSRVLDVVLTERGRRLFANGELEFAYVAFFDDGIDYDPYSTGSLTDLERDELIRSTPMLEPAVVPDRRAAQPILEPTGHLFKASPGYQGVPAVTAPSQGSRFDLRCRQEALEGVFRRFATGFIQIDLGHSGGVPDEGFSVRVYSSGSAGLREVRGRIDLTGRRALDPFIAVSVDHEEPVDPSRGRRR